MKGNKFKLIIGIPAVIVCILFGCKKRETVSFAEFGTEGEEQEITVEVEKEPSETSLTTEVPWTAEMPQPEETPQPEEKLIVHICGAVVNPGVYELPQGSRIYQAIEAAGGFLEEARQDFLNQAESLRDGSRIYVPTIQEAEDILEKEGQSFITEAAASVENNEKSVTGSETGQGSLVNINTASEAELCTLTGIGSSKAKSIIAYRTENGSFRKIEDIMNVEGIKDGMFQKIKNNITV